ncbi:MAG: DNA/RNA non-specific endonuclease [Tannerellaceae bacterium]|jgi:endonuclease G|nr:DNA/RNA non-specific endonuclease [Tannerellaceae bacterium]
MKAKVTRKKGKGRRQSKRKSSKGTFWGGVGRILFWAILLAVAIVVVVFFYECNPGEMTEGQSLELPEGAEIPQWREVSREGEEEIIHRTGYVLSYNSGYRLANWVAWALTATEALSKEVERNDFFRADPDVTGKSAQVSDYKNSGYDRGHLAPAGDMKWSEQAMKESFYLSNICPQISDLNRGIWKTMEEECRQWAVDYGEILIVAGPVVEEGSLRIGKNEIIVPQRFYKVICRLSDNKYHGIAFLLENRAYEAADWKSLAISIDSVEKVTGIDFFPLLPDREEEVMESVVEVSVW